MKFFAKILALIAFVSIFGGAHAQVVTYKVSVPASKIDLASATALSIANLQQTIVGSMFITYRSNGFEAWMQGETQRLEITGNTATVKIGKLFINLSNVGESYWHKNVGAWVHRRANTSFGDRGVAKMFYVGLTPSGRLYREELWLNGQRLNESETVLDHSDQIVWSRVTDREGILLLSRL